MLRAQFVDAFSRAADGELSSRGGGDDPHNIWIMKPTSSSRGRGIYLLDDIGDVSYGEPMVVQVRRRLRTHRPTAGPWSSRGYIGQGNSQLSATSGPSDTEPNQKKLRLNGFRA
jgi:hypothetical protein